MHSIFRMESQLYLNGSWIVTSGKQLDWSEIHPVPVMTCFVSWIRYLCYVTASDVYVVILEVKEWLSSYILATHLKISMIINIGSSAP